jgi:heptosyltransferase-3
MSADGAPGRILVVATQRLGDVLLATPLIRSLRLAWPQAHIAALVFADTASILAANTDVDAVWTIPRRPTHREHVRLLRRLWRRFDLALSTGCGDRPTLYACVAGKRRIGLLEDGAKNWWKRWLLDGSVPFDNLGTHTVAMNLQLADLAGIRRSHAVVADWRPEDEAVVREAVGSRAYAVLHLQPRFVYKEWHAAGWTALGRWLAASGLRIVLTGSDDAEERVALDRVLPTLPQGSLSVAGRFTLAQVACLLDRARLYVGPDTVITHMAAALGTPTVARYGPSNLVKWGPWPRVCRAERSPFSMRGTQRSSNVIVVQGDGDCVPCTLEGCERHVKSLSACLQQLPAQKVIDAAATLLEGPGSRASHA